MAAILKDMKLQAQGITCSSCTADMEAILRNTRGIADATVTFSNETIHIRYDPEVIDRKQVFLAARKLGFDLKIISES